MNLGCFALERGAWPFREVEELEERTFLTCEGEEGKGPQEPIPGWQAVGGGFGVGFGGQVWGRVWAVWIPQELPGAPRSAGIPGQPHRTKCRAGKGLGRTLQALGQSWELSLSLSKALMSSRSFRG